MAEHFVTDVLKTAARYQYGDGTLVPGGNEAFNTNGFAEQVLSGIKDMQPAKVITELI